MKIAAEWVIDKLMETNTKSKYKVAAGLGQGACARVATPRAGSTLHKGQLQGQGACTHGAAPKAGGLRTLGSAKGRERAEQGQLPGQGACTHRAAPKQQ